MQKYFFKETTHTSITERLGSKPKLLFSVDIRNNDHELDLVKLKNELVDLKEFLKHYVVNISCGLSQYKFLY